MSGTIANQHKQRKAALTTPEALLSKAFRSSPTPLAITRASDGMFVDVNREFERASGLSASEVIGRNATELDLWIDPRERDANIAGIARDGSVRDMRVHLRRKDGGERICEMASETIEIGGERFVVSQTHDLTWQRSAEEARRKAELMYRMIFENAVEGTGPSNCGQRVRDPAAQAGLRCHS